MNLEEKKMVIVLNPEMNKGQLANRSAVLSTGITHLHPEILGDNLLTKDQKKVNAITRVPIAVLAYRKNDNLERMAQKAEEKGCTVMVYLEEAQGLRSYQEYEDIIKVKEYSNLGIDAILLYGNNKSVTSLTGNLPKLS